MLKEKALETEGVGNSTTLHLDEIALKKGHSQFETVIYTGEKVLGTMAGKNSQNLQARLKQIVGIERIQTVSLDMCASFAQAVRLALPQAEIVCDRFHLLKLLHKRLDKLRIRAQAKSGRRFSHIRYVLFKDYKGLCKDQRRLVKDYLRRNPEIKILYGLSQGFRAIVFGKLTRKQASRALLEWCQQARKYLSGFVKTLETWWDEVVNACIYSTSNGRAEGINNKLKLVKRLGYGFNNRLNFQHRILAACNL